jgi:glycosyltransferase involved in cell wall biosynthesis
MKQKYESGYGQEGVPSIPAQVCYNGIDLEKYPYQKDKSDRFLFLGRIDPIKGVHTAIEVAEKTGVGLDVVGATSFVNDMNYVKQIKAKCSQLDNVEFIGEVTHDEKVKYLKDAKCLLAPSTFEEPFGLHLCESMACGTPIIGTRDGALPEVIEHGETGYICDSLDEMTQAVGKVDSLSSSDCRERVEERFTYQVMSRRYLQLYRMILEGTEW